MSKFTLRDPTLHLIFGPMKSCKSGEGIRIAQTYARYVDVVYVNPKMDIRVSDGTVESRSGAKWACISVGLLEELETNEQFLKAKLVILDETAFMPDLYEHVVRWCDEKSYVVIGLDGDWQQKKFGQILDLIPIADEVQKVCALCEICQDGTKAVCTKATQPLDSQIEVVGKESTVFIPVCRKHRK